MEIIPSNKDVPAVIVFNLLNTEWVWNILLLFGHIRESTCRQGDVCANTEAPGIRCVCVCVFDCCMRISLFAHSWASRIMWNKADVDVPWRWTWDSALFDFLALDMAASQHQRLEETRAAALRGSPLTCLSISVSVVLCAAWRVFLSLQICPE